MALLGVGPGGSLGAALAKGFGRARPSEYVPTQGGNLPPGVDFAAGGEWQFPAGADVFTGDAYSVLFWISVPDNAAGSDFGNIVSGTSAGEALTTVQLKQSGVVAWTDRETIAGTLTLNSSVAVDDEEWHWVLLVKAADNDRTFYIDGTSVATSSTSSNRTTASTARQWGTTGSNRIPSPSCMRRMMLFDAAITVEDAEVLAFAGTPTPPASCVAWYEGDEVGSPTDDSGSGNGGTEAGTVTLCGDEVATPLTPGAISAVVASETSVTLSGNAATGGTSPYTYQWHRSTSSGFTPGAGTEISGFTSLSETDTGLSTGTTYYYILASTDDASDVVYSSQRAATPSVAGTALFEDNFETGSFGPSQNGVSWGGSGGSNGGISSSTDRAFTGSYSILFRYGACAVGQDAYAEKRFNLPNMPEFWLEYMLWIPANYAHRSDGGPTNNKWFGAWKGSYTNNKLDLIMETKLSFAGGISRLRGYGVNVTADGFPGWPAKDPFIGNSGPLYPGQWNQVQYHYRVSSSQGAADGCAEILAAGTQINVTTGEVWPEDGTEGYFTEGYILGWSNSGFDEEQRFYVDRFRVYDSYPGWGDA